MKLTDIILENNFDDIQSVQLTYVEQGGRLYSIHINGNKLRTVADEAEGKAAIENITGLEVPSVGSHYDDKVLKVIEKLKDKGIDAAAYPMDVD
jgi:aspartate/glutamate racemase